VVTHAAEIKGWTHLALVYVENVPRLFVNGAEVRKGSRAAYRSRFAGQKRAGIPRAALGHPTF